MTYLDYPTELWSEILPGLHQGGTDDLDVIGAGVSADYGSDSLPRRFWASDFELVSFLAKFKKLDEVIELYVLAASHPEFNEGLREIAWDLVCRLDDSAPAGAMDPEDF